MAMVTIERAGLRTRVSYGAYEKIFKKKGYRVISKDEPKKTNVNETSETDEESTDEGTGTGTGTGTETESESDMLDIETIPISDMTKEQLIEFARKYDISLAGTRNPREAKAVIRKVLQERKM